jgi:hypothetical protein
MLDTHTMCDKDVQEAVCLIACSYVQAGDRVEVRRGNGYLRSTYFSAALRHFWGQSRVACEPEQKM